MTDNRMRHAPLVLLAVVLLLIGTAGGAVAAKLITGKDVKDSSLTGKDVKTGSLTGTDVKDGSVGAKELSSSARTSLKGNAGTPGVSGYENVVAVSSLTPNGNVAALTLAYCPRGKKALGGGAYWVGFAPLSTIAGSGPFKASYAADGTPTGSTIATSTDASGWGASGHNLSGGNSTLYVWVTCANVS